MVTHNKYTVISERINLPILDKHKSFAGSNHSHDFIANTCLSIYATSSLLGDKLTTVICQLQAGQLQANRHYIKLGV